MSDGTPHRRPRHALHEPEPVDGEVGDVDEPTQVLPTVPAQRSGVPVPPSVPLPAFVPLPSRPLDEDRPADRAFDSCPDRASVPVRASVPGQWSGPDATSIKPEGASRPSAPTWTESPVAQADPTAQVGPSPGTAVPGDEPRRRAVAAALAGVTAVLLVAGVVVGIAGGSVTDVAQRPAPTTTP